MDAVVRWSPHSTPEHPRFVILNLSEHNLKLLQAEKVEGNSLQYRQLNQRSKLPAIRAFDWSPTEEGVVAFGLPSGEAALLRIDDNSNDLLSFTIKHQRVCNAVALSTRGLLAAGLDKVRNDFCLNIWDVEHRLSIWDRSTSGWATARPATEPVRKLATSETITSIKFFAHTPENLVTGVKGQFVRIYDLRGGPYSCLQKALLTAQNRPGIRPSNLPPAAPTVFPSIRSTKTTLLRRPARASPLCVSGTGG